MTSPNQGKKVPYTGVSVKDLVKKIEELPTPSKEEPSSKKSRVGDKGSEPQRERARASPVKCCPTGGKGALKKRGCIPCPPEVSEERGNRKTPAPGDKTPLKEEQRTTGSKGKQSIENESLKTSRKPAQPPATEASSGRRSSSGFKGKGAAKAVGLGVALSVAPQLHQGLRDASRTYKKVDDWITQVQKEAFGPSRSDIDGNELKGQLIDSLRAVAEKTLPFKPGYTPSYYESRAGVREREDAALKYKYPQADQANTCMRTRGDPSSDARRQSYLESINCADMEICYQDHMHPPCMRIGAPSNQCVDLPKWWDDTVSSLRLNRILGTCRFFL
ncbi:hypothetical protein CDD81_232 [Ophiocordyceps australis]|uniref:Uncharacterized protein n=1 Tax=Ophiocordyceps australis TaxID=1399860 RepID=A0A2C5XBI2_9HYPO|nr:hypothetical protein CDD81_232 [Ophiocordyceps australis]